MTLRWKHKSRPLVSHCIYFIVCFGLMFRYSGHRGFWHCLLLNIKEERFKRKMPFSLGSPGLEALPPCFLAYQSSVPHLYMFA